MALEFLIFLTTRWRNPVLDLFGKSPVPIPLLVTGKLSFFFCLFFPLASQPIGGLTLLFDNSLTRIIGVTLYGAGLLVVLVSLVQLGRSVAVGLPERETQLRTHGMYRFSRNPVYVGGFMMCAGSCLFAMHPLNFLSACVAVVIHLRIVRREEEFLEQRFGERWLEYKARVPRYLGRQANSDGRP
jgi:protein-S-isoprenylcysteine O-methyltransferase Ste14